MNAPSIEPNVAERAERDAVMARILDHIRSGVTIKLPPFDRHNEVESKEFALLSLTDVENPYGGRIGDYRYQFEGEEDLLHLFVLHADGLDVSVEAGRAVASFVLLDVPPALIWFKPGTRSQHFYVGHDVLLESLPLE
jgi:hypothetical protein